MGQHMPNGMNDIYNTQAAMYSMPQPAFGQNPLAPQMHPIQPQSIDGYVLQNVGNPGMAGGHPNAFAGASFAGVNPFAPAMAGTMNDPYQRNGFAYGM